MGTKHGVSGIVGRRWVLQIAAISVALGVGYGVSEVLADMSAHGRSAEEIIWSHELEIYKRRGEGSLDKYLSVAHREFLGWPPQWSEPSDYSGMQAWDADAEELKGEKVELFKKKFTMVGDAALIYYATRRTSLGGGEAVDQHFDVIHVWYRVQDDWKLIGGMARRVSGDSRPPPPGT